MDGDGRTMPTDGFLEFVEFEQNTILLGFCKALLWVFCLGSYKSSIHSQEPLLSIVVVSFSVDTWGA